MRTITIVQLYAIKSLRGLRAGGRATPVASKPNFEFGAGARATAGAKRAGDASSMAADNAAQPVSRRESGHRRHSTIVLIASQGEWRRCFRRHLILIIAKRKMETKQVASKSSWRAPITFLDDCELWFDITQGGVGDDGDGLTYWQEVRERAPGVIPYGTDPTSFTDDDVDFDGLTGTQEKAQGSKPFMKNSDGDGLTDYEEYQLGTGAMHWGKDIDLYYRVVSVEPKFPVNVENGFTTNVVNLIEDERDLTDNDDVSSAVSMPGIILYPAIGCPEFIDKSASLTLEFSTLFAAIEFVSLDSITNPGIIESWDWAEVSFLDSYQDDLGRIVMNCSVPLPSSIPSGLYNLTIVTSGNPWVWHTAYHSVQVLDSFKSSFKFVQLTDVHIGNSWKSGQDSNNVGDFLAIINRINKLEKPDFMIISGDLTDSGNAEETKYFKACLLTCEVPVFLTTGNHDFGNPLPTSGSIDNYNNYLVPRFDSGGEGDLDDYSFNYGDYHFISFDSGSVTDVGNPAAHEAPHLSGLTTAQLDWMKSDYIMHDNGLKHTFIFTHGPIVGHGGVATHDTYALVSGSVVKIADRDIPFVEWVNEDGMTVEAVFCGHTHMSGGYIDIDTSNMFMDYFNLARNSISYTQSTVYLETSTACADYTYEE